MVVVKGGCGSRGVTTRWMAAHDGAVTHSLCNDFGTRLHVPHQRAHREQLCLGGWVQIGGGLQRLPLHPPPLTELSPGRPSENRVERGY